MNTEPTFRACSPNLRLPMRATRVYDDADIDQILTRGDITEIECLVESLSHRVHEINQQLHEIAGVDLTESQIEWRKRARSAKGHTEGHLRRIRLWRRLQAGDGEVRNRVIRAARVWAAIQRNLDSLDSNLSVPEDLQDRHDSAIDELLLSVDELDRSAADSATSSRSEARPARMRKR